MREFAKCVYIFLGAPFMIEHRVRNIHRNLVELTKKKRKESRGFNSEGGTNKMKQKKLLCYWIPQRIGHMYIASLASTVQHSIIRYNVS
uniref:Uncharacterized protein n=1 Tax=Trichogramma kaykai TaxID=54128 RepID=A0ABD2XDA5_9HYME